MKILRNSYEDFAKQLRNKAEAFIRDSPDIACDYIRAADDIEELCRENESLGKSVNDASELLRKRWIPLTNRLPEPFDRVIVYDKRWGALSAMKGEDDSWGGRNDIVIEKVTHWMPLPEPPKEESNGWEV